ncbi:MAG: HYR domain-containing protein, partial [Planctomycetes bacterium]|nr:HYR domain-containing protein [Planctomycetota bacterium]
MRDRRHETDRENVRGDPMVTGRCSCIVGWIRNAAFVLLALAAPASAQIMITDDNEYSPGDTAIVSGFGYGAGETVQVDFGCTGSVPTSTQLAVADENGNFTGMMYDITELHVGQRCTATGTGLTSGLVAVARFVDAPLGLGRVTSVTPVDGGCVRQNSTPTNAVERWDVEQSKTYQVTLSNLTDCAHSGTDATIGVLVKSSNTGNICLTATKQSTGVYRFNVTMPSTACFTYPIQYCVVNCSPSTSGSFLARRSDGGGKQSHLRAATFGPNCSSPKEDQSCNGGCSVTLTCPSDITQCNDGGRCDARVTFTVTPVCTCPPVSAVCNPASGSLFPVGTTTVTCTAADGHGNNQSCQFHVTVNDCEPPKPRCPASFKVECTSNGHATATFTVTATDNCPGTPTIVCTPASGSTFNLGTTQVCCTATDAAGNHDQCCFNVTVEDKTAPVIHCPANITADCTSAAGASVTFTTTATDLCDPAPTIACTPASGSNFPFGTTQVCCTATDHSGNSSSCCFNVTVVDRTPPTITCPADFSRECTSSSGKPVTFTVTASDTCDPNPTIVCDHPSGSTFPIGTTTVCCTATDAHLNSSQCCFHITIVDSRPPAISCPLDITAECTGPNGAPVTFTTTATDTCDPNPTIVCTPLSGSNFPFGTTQVCCTATDHNGNSSQCCFNVTVVDHTPPAITCPADINRVCTGPDGKAVTFTTTA